MRRVLKAPWLRSRKIWLFILGGFLIAVLGSLLPISDWLAQTETWLTSLGGWAAPTFILLYLVATVLGLPNILLMLVAGTLFGLLSGIIYVSIADTLGAIACYAIGRTIARKRIKQWMSKHPSFIQLDRAVNQKGWRILLLARLSPLVPSNVLNYGFSCTKVDFRQYCFFSWLGMLPVISLYVYLGVFGRSLMMDDELSPEKVILQAVGLVLAIGAALYTAQLVKKHLSPDCPSK